MISRTTALSCLDLAAVSSEDHIEVIEHVGKSKHRSSLRTLVYPLHDTLRLESIPLDDKGRPGEHPLVYVVRRLEKLEKLTLTSIMWPVTIQSLRHDDSVSDVMSVLSKICADRR